MSGKHYTTVDGLFGQKIHYDEQGRYAGESWPGLFSGSMEHYNADGNYVGYSDPGLFSDHIHHDASGAYIGETWDGLASQKIHYDQNGYAGESWDTSLLGTSTFFDSDTDLFEL